MSEFISLDRRQFLMGVGALTMMPAMARADIANKRRIIVAMPSGPQLATLEPVRESTNVAFRVGYNVFDTLIAVDFKNGFKLVPGLATKWERISSTETVFTLRENVRFHNNDIMTADDVVFSFGQERMMDAKAPGYALGRQFFPTLAAVEATGPMTVKFTTKGPDPLIEKRIAGWTGQIISKKAFLAAPSFADWEKAPVGTGPFKVKIFKQDEQIALVAHEDYFGGRAKIDELVFRVVPELASRLNMLKTGEADLVTELAPDQIPVVEGMTDREVTGGPILNIRGLIYDKSHSALVDARVRQALSMSIDRQAIVASLYDGRTKVPQGPQHESYGDLFIKDYKGIGFDAAGAKALLKDAGYTGAPIPYRVLNNYYTLQIQTAQILGEMWKSVGLNVVIETKENWAQVLDPNGRGIFDSSDTIFWQDPVGAMVRRYGPQSGLQVQVKAWSNDEFNKLCGVMLESLDPVQRRAAFQRSMEIYDRDDPPGTYLHDLTLFYGKSKAVAWAAYPVEFMDFRSQNT